MQVWQSCAGWSATNVVGAANSIRCGKVRGGLEAAESRRSEERAPVRPWAHNPTACCGTIAEARRQARESKSRSISFQAWFAPSFLFLNFLTKRFRRQLFRCHCSSFLAAYDPMRIWEKE